MAPIIIKEITKVTSEDEKYPAANLLNGKKWMSAVGDQTAEISVEFLFEKPMQIHYIDIGYCNVASMKIQVGLESWPTYKEMLVILPTMMTQTSIDAKMGKNKSGCKMFNYEDHLKPDVAKKFWDKIKVILWQPYTKNKQFGLEFIRFGTPKNTETKLNTTPQKQITDYQDKNFTSQNPNLTKLMEKIRQKNLTPNNSLLEKKLKRLSGSGHVENDESALNRTAKMVLASKMKSPNLNGLKSPSSIKNSANPSKSLNIVKNITPAKNPKQQKQFLIPPKNQSSSTSSQHKEQCHKTNTKVKKNLTPSKSNIQKNQNEFKTTDKKINKDQHKKSISPGKIISENQIKEKNIPKSELIESPTVQTETVYTEKQIKQLKKAIKRFFNELDMDNFNPNEVKLKDLRKQFESKNDVKLNRDGRSYFQEVTSRFVNLVSNHQQHQQSDNLPGTSAKRKLHESPSHQSPAKVKKPSPPIVITSSPSIQPQQLFLDPSVEMVACPICMEMFAGSTIELHAASCGDSLTYNSEPSLSNQSHNTVNRINQLSNAPGSHVDTSENSTLTPDEQLKWIQYSKEPKPYQKRINRADFEGCKLMKCPTCGQLYKSSEIQIHSDDCAEKVNCGLTKMGLYYVDKKKKISKPTKLKGPIIIDD